MNDKKILVVDDNPINLAVARGFLNTWGFIIDTANDGREAIKLFAAQKYHCILMDIHMPYMSGLEASLEIRKIEESIKCQSTPIIAFTADAFIDNETLNAAKINTKLLKPIKPEALKQLLDQVLSNTISEKMLQF